MKTRLCSVLVMLCLLTSLLPVGALAASHPFRDVSKSHWAHASVQYVYDRDLMGGTEAEKFSPETNATRGMLWTILARLDGVDTAGSPWYAKGQEWAKSKGISDGANPGGSITREQLATMLYRYAGAPNVKGTLTQFSDGVQVSGYAQAAMVWAVNQKFITGMGDGTLAPQGSATRAQVAAILMRFDQSGIVQKPVEKPEPEPETPPEEDPKPDPIPVTEPSDSRMVENIRSSSLPKKDTLACMAESMLDSGLDPAFVAGALGNIIAEGACGIFEVSKYSNPDRKPAYLVYMEENYDYDEKYSGKYIYDGISLSEIKTILDELGTAGANGRGSCWGLGAMQWTHYNRIGLLVDKYIEAADGADTITKEQCFAAEGEMIAYEFQHSYKRVWTDWQKENPIPNSMDAAYQAGVIVCTRYGIPATYKEEATQNTRGNNAVMVYAAMVGVD